MEPGWSTGLEADPMLHRGRQSWVREHRIQKVSYAFDNGSITT